jgi:uncharacterized protein YukE
MTISYATQWKSYFHGRNQLANVTDIYKINISKIQDQAQACQKMAQFFDDKAANRKKSSTDTESSWGGNAAESYRAHQLQEAKVLQEQRDRMTTLVKALNAYMDQVAWVKNSIDHIVTDWNAHFTVYQQNAAALAAESLTTSVWSMIDQQTTANEASAAMTHAEDQSYDAGTYLDQAIATLQPITNQTWTETMQVANAR